MARIPLIWSVVTLCSCIVTGTAAMEARSGAPPDSILAEDSTPPGGGDLLSAQPGRRPTIGLALSGGGARGLALIGALRLIEELRIPVDYIAGTSMGAIVAAFYAVGMSPDEIERTMTGVDWQDLFTDAGKRSDRTFRRKQDDGAQFFNFEVGLRGIRPVMAAGLVSGQKMAFGIRNPFIHTSADQDFDDLRIRYRAVATDLETGEMVVLSSGSLFHAVRASMSIPGVFTPVRLDGRFLVDGGLVRNLPVDVVKEMGADIVIAVDVGPPLGEPGAGGTMSISEVSRQSFNIYLKQTSLAVLGMADLYIPLPLQGISSADFRMAAAIVGMGEGEAREYAGDLSRYAAGGEDYARFIGRHRHAGPPVRRIASIRIENESRMKDAEIHRRLDVRPGDIFDQDGLKSDFERIYETGVMESIDYRILDEDRGSTLIISARGKSYSGILNLGFDYVDDLEGRTDFGLLARYSRLEMNGRGAEARLNLRLGLSRGVSIEYYQPLDPRRILFVAPSVEASTVTRDVFDGDHRAAEYQARFVGAGLDAGLQIGRFAEIRFGAEHKRINTVVDVGYAGLPEEWKTRNALRAGIECDLLDCPDFPASGGATSLAYYRAIGEMGGEEEYETISLEGAGFASAGRMTLFGTLSAMSDLGTVLPCDERFLFGGPLSFSGLKEGQLAGGALGIARAGVRFLVSEGKVLVGPDFHAGFWVETGNVWDAAGETSFDDMIVGGSLFVGMKTILGPVMAGYGRSEGGNGGFFLTAGRQFGSL
ncbi:MAG: patatin-like phospholipase family protein [Candidatus Krumholzibacteria bacterium]|nr:patatin-like phospholipase family protein [Candidatus Krumholzibacteria bacterium]